MKFEHAFIAFGVLSGAVLSLLGAQVPVIKMFPALLLLLGTILLFDLAAAYIRGVSVMGSVSTVTRLIAFCSGVLAIIVSGGLW